MSRLAYIYSSALLVLLALAWVGCDSSDPEDEEPTDADVFVGTWAVTGVSINDQEVGALILTQLDEASARFDGNGLDDDGAFSGVVVRDGERSELVTRYELDEAEGTVTFTGGVFESPVALDYTIESNDRIVLESNDATFLAAFADDDLSGFEEINSIELVLTR